MAQSELKPSITEREREILLHIVKGLTYEQIAGKLGISRSRVSRHIKQLKQRFSARNRNNLVYKAVIAGLI